MWGAPPPNVHEYDVVIGQRIAGEAEGWHNLCRDPNVLAVYDIDDDLLNIDPENSVPYSIYAPIRDETARNIAAADLVTVSTPKLAERLEKLNRNVVVLPNCVPRSLTEQRRPHNGGGRLTLGWAGSMFHGQDWVGMPRHLAEVRHRLPGTRFHVIGADYTLGAVGAEVSGWTDVERYYRTLDFEVGVAPLLRSSFNECKSWIKLVEYAALGIPAVATAAGQYPEWVEHGENGLLVRADSEWVPHMMTLLADADARTHMANNALAKAREYTIENQVHRWDEAYLKYL